MVSRQQHDKRNIGGESGEKKRGSAHIIPQAENENHASLKPSLDVGKTTLLREVVGLAKGAVLGRAVRRGDGVAREARNVSRLGSANKHAVLDVVTHDVVQVTGGVGQELGHHRDHLVSVNSQTRAEEVGGAVAVGVPVAAVGVTVASVAVCCKGAAAGGAVAHVLALGGAWVEGESVGNLVCLPDIELVAAAAELANTRVLVVGGGFPTIGVALKNAH